MVKFGRKSAFLHPCYLSGRETAQIQSPTHTLDPKLIYFYAEVFHMFCITSLDHSVLHHLPDPLKVKNGFYAEVFHMFCITSLNH